MDAAMNCFSGAAVKGDPEGMVLYGNFLIEHGNADIDTMGGLVYLFKAVVLNPGYVNHVSDAIGHPRVNRLMELEDNMLENLKAAVLSHPTRQANELDRRAVDMIMAAISDTKSQMKELFGE